MQRIKIVDYLKAIFILLVIITHAEVIPVENLINPLVIDQAVPGFMILSGYMFAFSSSGKKMKEMYHKNKLIKKVYRFIIPAIISYFVYLVGWHLQGSYQLTMKDIVYRFIMGLYGPGGYYCGIMLQFILVAPIVWEIIRRFNKNGILAITALNLMFEIMVRVWMIDESIYRVLIFRYLLLIAAGMYLYLNIKSHTCFQYLVVSWILGALYLVLPYLTTYEYRLFTLWSSTSMMTTLYIYPIMYFILKQFELLYIENLAGQIFEEIGKASYHIMYTQMIYYVGVKNILYGVINLQIYGGFVEIVFAIVVSVISGYIFYELDNFLLRPLLRYKKRGKNEA